MLTAIATVFVMAYAAIALEHPLRVNKSASALVCAGLLWTTYALWAEDSAPVSGQLGVALIATAQIVLFLMAAMTIVVVIDAHDGFDVITARIKPVRLSGLIWLVGTVTFFLSAILDNLTTTIVMVSLIRKLLHKHDDRLMFAGIVVIAANSGGVWSPIGDVTTTMLWIGGQITSLAIIKSLLLPSLVSLLLPLGVTAFLLRGRPVVSPPADNGSGGHHATGFERNLMFFLGLAILVAVPAFKTLTNLPPFMGILLGLGVLWIVGDLLHRNKPDEEKQRLTLVHAMTKIDMASIMFFVGILLSVATLEHSKMLASLAVSLDRTVGRQDLIVLIIGIASAIVDNVPLVAAAMGMYSLTTFPTDHFIWAFLAYCSGTGGSILVIGSAAGVAAMGLEKITFTWYFKHVSGLALLGYLAGAGTYLVQHALVN